MKYQKTICSLAVVSVVVFNLNAQTYTGLHRTPSSNTDWHQFMRTGGGAVVYMNQGNSSGAILRMSSGTLDANQNVKFSFESNGRMGIGTKSPLGILHITQGSSGDAQVFIEADSDNNNENDNPRIIFKQDGGLEESSIEMGNNNLRIRNSVSSHGGIAFETGSVNGYDNAVERMRITSNGRVGIGTDNPGNYRLAVEGKLGAREVVVTEAPWADHVFKDSYNLKPLTEVENFIKENKHLEGIPTENDVKEKGVNVGEIQAKLLEKVEELTLYMIEMKKENEQLKARLSSVEKNVK